MPVQVKDQTESQSSPNTTQDDDDTHINETGVRQPNPPRVNMFKLVNHIEATKGSQGKHLKFPIVKHPKEPYKHHIVVRVDTGAEVNCMNEKTFNEFFQKCNFLYAPMRYRILEIQLQTFLYQDNSLPTWSLGVQTT